MKKIILLSLVVVLLFSGTSYADNALTKLGRGVCNVITCPFEIIHRMGEANDERGPFAGLTWGLLDGIYKMGLRAIVGVYEVATFPIPLPAGYAPIITDPEFFLEGGVL